MSADDNIAIVPYDRAWPEKAQEEITQLRRIFDETYIIEHVGSTAIPDLDAKPVIDILIICDDIERARKHIPQMRELDYQFWEENPDPSHLLFVKGMPPYGSGRTHHVHIHPHGHDKIRRKIVFRDRLLQNPDIAKSYQSLKYQLADLHRDDREAYTQAKTEFIDKALSGESIS